MTVNVGSGVVASTSSTPKISLRGVTKAFGDNVVLRDFSLDVSAGEVVSLIGASGSGKTTVLRCINLLEQIDDGAVLLDGEDPNTSWRERPNPTKAASCMAARARDRARRSRQGRSTKSPEHRA
ncbi:MAG: amino acid ABC transporter ATP-binding protein [Acidimicrobiia bacterium]|nr:amino acid ABC transporter ATP-binding protein [Acidimicrobiia bacterium]